MSSAATTYKLYHADTNSITELKLFDDQGNELTPQSIANGTDDPTGWKSKDITFADQVEAVFVTPTWQNVNAPLPVYLGWFDGGYYNNVLNNSVVDPNFITESTRPTPKGEYAAQYGGSSTYGPLIWEIKPPTYFTPKIIPRTKDPLTGEKLYGNEYRMLWGGKFPDNIEVQVDLENITDPSGFYTVPYTNITGYAESSVGMCLVKVDSDIIPQDGLTYTLRFRIRYNFGGDVGDWVQGGWQKAVYVLPPPNLPRDVTATVLRDRNGDIPDRIRVNWTWATTNPGDAVEVYAIDVFGKKHLISEETDNEVTSVTVENVTRFYTIDRPPAVQTSYRFGVIAKNRTTKSTMVTTTSSVLLTSRIADDTPPTPDEIAGTAVDVSHVILMARAAAEAQAMTGDLTAEQKGYMAALMPYSVQALIKAIKKVVMTGGRATINDFGTFKARWTAERIGVNPTTGQPTTIPAKRSQSFLASIGYRYGTANGSVMNDAQAKALP